MNRSKMSFVLVGALVSAIGCTGPVADEDLEVQQQAQGFLIVNLGCSGWNPLDASGNTAERCFQEANNWVARCGNPRSWWVETYQRSGSTTTMYELRNDHFMCRWEKLGAGLPMTASEQQQLDQLNAPATVKPGNTGNF